jgi:hypothetical protein
LPDVVLVDPVLPDLSGEELAARLRADPRTIDLPLVALSSDARPARRTSCLEAGFTAFLVKSPQLLPSLRQALVTVVSPGQMPHGEDGLLIAFLSAKGGTGTSSLCANLAMNIADQDRKERVVVLDLVLPIGSIAGIVGYTGTQNVVTLSKMPAGKTTPEFLDESLALLNPWRFHILAGAPDPGKSIELDFGRVGQLIGSLRSAFDVVVVDSVVRSRASACAHQGRPAGNDRRCRPDHRRSLQDCLAVPARQGGADLRHVSHHESPCWIGRLNQGPG